jgi:hypothetical protein
MTWKGFARKWSHQGAILEFDWRNWETPFRITSNPAKIQTKHLPNVTAVSTHSVNGFVWLRAGSNGGFLETK